MQWAFLSALIMLCTVAVARRNFAQMGTLVLLFVNWAACTSFVYITSDVYPWLFFIVADYLTALGLYVIRKSHWQSAVMGVFGLQLICHAAFGLSSKGIGPTYYSYWALSYLAWTQVAICGGWIGLELIRGWGRASSGGFRVEASAKTNMAEEKGR